MNILRLIFAVTLVLLLCVSTTTPQEEAATSNVTQWAKSRQKRFLIFQTQGVQKFIISFVLTLDLKDKRAWRSLAGAWNFQWQHNLPLVIQQWWNSTYFPSPGRKRSIGEATLPTAPQEHPVDISAMLLYAMVESFMNNKGVDGRECLQRAICENAQVNYVGGVLDSIYKRLLTPEIGMDEYYHDSYAAGLKGADCYRTYRRCPKGTSVFDQFVYIDDL